MRADVDIRLRKGEILQIQVKIRQLRAKGRSRKKIRREKITMDILQRAGTEGLSIHEHWAVIK